MKTYLLIILLVFGAFTLHAQDHALFYTGGTKSYLGLSYMRVGEAFGLGLSFAATPGTFTVDHENAYAMNEDEIKDGGEYSWRYADEYVYDRFFLTGRLYLNVAASQGERSSWAYFGVGPGESRNYFGYDRSASNEIEYVLDETSSADGHTELEVGYLYIDGSLVLAVGYSGINFAQDGQLTFGLGFTF